MNFRALRSGCIVRVSRPTCITLPDALLSLLSLRNPFAKGPYPSLMPTTGTESELPDRASKEHP